MRSVTSGPILFSLLMLLSLSAHAQSTNELRGYTPPPMFGGTSTALSPPVAAAPAPVSTPEVQTSVVTAPPVIAPKPAPEKKIFKITTPPADKETYGTVEPLPIETLRPARGKTAPAPAEKEKIPAYVAPAKKPDLKSLPKPVAPPEETRTLVRETPTLKPVEAAPVIVAPGLNAEALLNHEVTSQGDTTMPAPVLNPMAVPASQVDDGLPLPGSVPAQKKITDKKTADKKSAAPVKKTEKTPEKKTPVKKEPLKKEAPKKEVKKVEPPKVVAKPAPKKEAVKPAAPVKAVAKPEVKIAPKVVAETPALPVPNEVKVIDKPAPPAPKIEDKSYTIKGKKTMPKVVPTKVDRAELVAKPPLPAIEAPEVKEIPTPNEKMIDMSLQDHLVQPDVKKIEAVAPPANGAAKQKDTPPVSVVPTKMPDKVKPQLLSLEFKPEVTELPADLKKTIDSDIVPKLSADKYSRLQILSYATASKEGQSSARRLSLARALSIRSYMLDKGVQPDRIDIRALGDNTTEMPKDRADLMVISYK